MESTKILPCTCEHEFQDNTYGKGMRLHNVSQGGTNKGIVAFCTVCSPRQPKIKTTTPPMPGIGMKNIQHPDPPRKGKSIKWN